ncbi:MAG: exodeoxyribonuclease III [Patescibacteria group bacterium]|jgi:exodeoxyribonuclease-3
MSITLLSWNVNGIRAAERKGFIDWLQKSEADIVCVQETKVHDPGILSEALKDVGGYASYWAGHEAKKGYSGVATYTKKEPKCEKKDFGKNSLLSREGRVQELDFGAFVLLNIYYPNGGSGQPRLDYKLKFYDQFLNYAVKLMKTRKVVVCGDVNTAHQEIDLARPKENADNSGFMAIERAWLDRFEAAGLIDTFRMKHPDEPKQYTYWDQKTRARDRNVGWRLDYFYISPNLKKQVKDAFILPDVVGSDHCPIGLTLTL